MINHDHKEYRSKIKIWGAVAWNLFFKVWCADVWSEMVVSILSQRWLPILVEEVKFKKPVLKQRHQKVSLPFSCLSPKGENQPITRDVTFEVRNNVIPPHQTLGERWSVPNHSTVAFYHYSFPPKDIVASVLLSLCQKSGFTEMKPLLFERQFSFCSSEELNGFERKFCFDIESRFGPLFCWFQITLLIQIKYSQWMYIALQT